MASPVKLIGNGISVFSASLVVLCTYRKRPLRTFDYPVLAIALSDICYSGAIFTQQCYVQFTLGSFGSTSTVLWTSALASLVYMSAKEGTSLERVLKWYGWGCVVFAAALTVVPMPIIGLTLIETCWVSGSNNWEVTVNRFVTFYGPLLLTMAWCMYVYCTVRVNSRQQLEMEVFNSNRRRTQLYPIALFISFGFMLVLRLLGIAPETKDFSEGPAYFIAGVLVELNGAMNSLVFFLTDDKVGFGTFYSRIVSETIN